MTDSRILSNNYFLMPCNKWFMLYCQNHISAVPIVILMHVIGSVCKTNALCNYAALSVYFDHSAKHGLCNYAAFSGMEVTDTYTDTIFRNLPFVRNFY